MLSSMMPRRLAASIDIPTSTISLSSTRHLNHVAALNDGRPANPHDGGPPTLSPKTYSGAEACAASPAHMDDGNLPLPDELRFLNGKRNDAIELHLLDVDVTVDTDVRLTASEGDGASATSTTCSTYGYHDGHHVTGTRATLAVPDAVGPCILGGGITHGGQHLVVSLDSGLESLQSPADDGEVNYSTPPPGAAQPEQTGQQEAPALVKTYTPVRDIVTQSIVERPDAVEEPSTITSVADFTKPNDLHVLIAEIIPQFALTMVTSSSATDDQLQRVNRLVVAPLDRGFPISATKLYQDVIDLSLKAETKDQQALETFARFIWSTTFGNMLGFSRPPKLSTTSVRASGWAALSTPSESTTEHKATEHKATIAAWVAADQAKLKVVGPSPASRMDGVLCFTDDMDVEMEITTRHVPYHLLIHTPAAVPMAPRIPPSIRKKTKGRAPKAKRGESRSKLRIQLVRKSSSNS